MIKKLIEKDALALLIELSVDFFFYNIMLSNLYHVPAILYHLVLVLNWCSLVLLFANDRHNRCVCTHPSGRKAQHENINIVQNFCFLFRENFVSVRWFHDTLFLINLIRKVYEEL